MEGGRQSGQRRPPPVARLLSKRVLGSVRKRLERELAAWRGPSWRGRACLYVPAPPPKVSPPLPPCPPLLPPSATEHHPQLKGRRKEGELTRLFPPSGRLRLRLLSLSSLRENPSRSGVEGPARRRHQFCNLTAAGAGWLPS